MSVSDCPFPWIAKPDPKYPGWWMVEGAPRHGPAVPVPTLVACRVSERDAKIIADSWRMREALLTCSDAMIWVMEGMDEEVNSPVHPEWVALKKALDAAIQILKFE